MEGSHGPDLTDVRREMRRAVKRWAAKEEGGKFLALGSQTSETLESIVLQVRSEYKELRKEFVISLVRRYIIEQRRGKKRRSSLLPVRPPVSASAPSPHEQSVHFHGSSARKGGSGSTDIMHKLNALRERRAGVSAGPSATRAASSPPGFQVVHCDGTAHKRPSRGISTAKPMARTKENAGERRPNHFARRREISAGHVP